MKHTRRMLLKTMGVGVGVSPVVHLLGEDTGELSLSTFSADITPPLGHPLLAGWKPPAKRIESRLKALGVVLWTKDSPIVICALDWCELRNGAYDLWRDSLAKAVGTSRERVLLHCVHQHDTPYVDLEAQQFLDQHGYEGMMFDSEFHAETVRKVAAAAKASADSKKRVLHIGTGEAEVKDIACNRRVEVDGKVSFRRYSFTRDPKVRDAATGQIDPNLKMLSFYGQEGPMVSISCYATHPMSYYGNGGVSADFTGMAREKWQSQNPDVFQIYLSGCSGDVTAAKFNLGNLDGRKELANRLARGMEAAWKMTRTSPVQKVAFRNGSFDFAPRTTGAYNPEVAQAQLANPKLSPTHRTQAAMTLSWLQRLKTGQAIDLPLIDFGSAQFLLLPAETFVGYQLAAQKMKPCTFLMTPAFGECAPGYIPTDMAEEEGYVKEHGYSWIAPGQEKMFLEAIREVLQ